MVYKIFIDTNVIVSYIILKKREETTKESKELWKEYKKIKPAYELMNLVFNNKDKEFKFYTSPLAVSEIFHSLYDEYRCRRMWKDGVPLSSWVNLKHRFNLTEDDIQEILVEILLFINDFIDKGKKIRFLDEIYSFELISNLVLDYKIETQDAILLSTAISKRCNHFVTRDRELREKKLNHIKIVSSNVIRDKMKKQSQGKVNLE